MKKVLTAIDAHTDRDEATYLRTMVQRCKNTRCVCCHGYGHTSNQCSSKKLVDTAVKAVGLRSYWGEVKSHLKMETYALRRTIATELRNQGRALIPQEPVEPSSPFPEEPMTPAKRFPEIQSARTIRLEDMGSASAYLEKRNI